MEKRDKGLTLIELIITLCLISILLSFTLISMDFFKSYENNIDVDYCNNSILSLIDNAKLYCKKENSNGYIQFDLVSNEVTFYCKSKQNQKVEEYILPKKFTICDVNSKYNCIRISINGMTIDGTGIDGMTTNGVTTNSCTISFKDRRNSIHKITIRVGTNYVEVKG